MTLAKSSSEILLNPKQNSFLQEFVNNKADIPDPKDPRGWGWSGGWRATAQFGRGSGKSHLLCHMIAISASELPRARAGLVGLTLRQVSDIILAQADEIFLQHGFVEYDEKTGFGHYTVQKKPPAHWKKCRLRIRNYDNCICFANGYTVEFLSVGNIQAKRGTNMDQLFIDESATIKEEHFEKILRPTVRANKYVYKDPRPGRKNFNHPLHWCIVDFTSAPWLPEGRWIYKTEDLAKQKPNKYYFLQGNAFDNIMFLPGDYIEDQRETLDPLVFDVEIMNKRRTKNPNSFYSALTEDNTYLDYERGDYDRNRPLELSFDFNAAFTSVSIWQDFGNTFDCIDTVYVKEADGDLLVPKLIELFTNKYNGQINKNIKIFGDHSGCNKDANRLPHFTVIKELLRAKKYIIHDEVQESYPSYGLRYVVVNELLKGTNPLVPKIRVNGWIAKSMLISLQDARIIGDNFEKNKASEKDKKIQQEYATHLSDTADYILYRKYSKYVKHSLGKNTPFAFR